MKSEQTELPIISWPLPKNTARWQPRGEREVQDGWRERRREDADVEKEKRGEKIKVDLRK